MLVQLYHSQLQARLEKYWKTKLSIMLHGTFGIGKTAGIRAFAQKKAKELKLKFSESFNDVNKEGFFCLLVLPLHQYEAAELKGLPFTNAERTKTIYLPVGLLPTEGKGIIFLDEINLAAPMVQSNAYQLIEDRRIGFYEIPKDYMVIGAGNKDDDRGHLFEMAMPLNNRFLHAELLVPPVDDITLTDEDGSETIRGWVNDYAIPNGVDNRIVNFLLYQKQYLYNYNPNIEVVEPTIATPRMWVKVSELIKGENSFRELRHSIGEGVGMGIANEFVAWLKLSATYDIKAIFKSLKFDKPAGIDVMYSLISAFVSHYLEDKSADNAIRLSKLSLMFNKEFTAMILSQVKYFDNDFFKKLGEADSALLDKIADEIVPLLI